MARSVSSCGRSRPVTCSICRPRSPSRAPRTTSPRSTGSTPHVARPGSRPARCASSSPPDRIGSTSSPPRSAAACGRCSRRTGVRLLRCRASSAASPSPESRWIAAHGGSFPPRGSFCRVVSGSSARVAAISSRCWARRRQRSTSSSATTSHRGRSTKRRAPGSSVSRPRSAGSSAVRSTRWCCRASTTSPASARRRCACCGRCATPAPAAPPSPSSRGRACSSARRLS